MLINLRNALMTGKRLPYDAEVEYLESTRTQYYLFSGKSINGIDCWVKPQTTIANINNAVGIWNNGSRADSITYESFQSRGFTVCAAGGGGYNGQEIRTGLGNALRHVIVRGTSITVDDYSATLPIGWRGGGISQDYFALFGCYNTSTGSVDRRSCQIGSCKLYSGQSLVYDFIPVRKGTVGYLYDRVSGKLFGNAGTGDFVLGPDVVPVEYIESHGTEWIDTGVKGRDGYDFEYRFRPIGPLPLGIGGEYESNQSCYIGLVRSNGYLAYNYSNPNDIVEVQSITLGTDYNVKAHLYSGKQYFEVNGVRGGVNSRTGAFTSSYNLYLFAINSANQPTNLGVMRLYDLTARLNTIPTRSFRPVRVGTEGAMMDVLTRRIYRNAGTGAFAYGDDLKYPIPA